MPINSVSLGWVNCFLGDVIVRVVGGGTPSRGISAYWMGNIPWASVKDFTDDTKYIQNTEEHISFSGLANSSANLIEVGIPVICTRMAVGRAAITGNSIAINQDLKALYLDNNIYSKYLLLLLKFLRPKFESLSIGSTVKGINIDQLLTICISLPPLYEQRRIAEILDTVDDAIARTSSLIIKLKQTKAGLLQDLLTRGLDDDGKLRDPQTHPEQFKDSLLGRIPKDWDILKIELLLNGRPKNGYSPKEVNEWTGTLMLGLGCLNEEGFEPLQLKNAPGNDSKVRTALLCDGDFLLSRSNTRERVALTGIYKYIGLPCIYPDLMMRLSINEKTSSRFLELLFRYYPVRRQLTGNAQGTSGSMVKISSQTVIETLVALANPTEQARIIEYINIYDTRIRTEEAYLNKLKLQKQGLMQDLLTGKVRVKNL